MPSVLSSNTIHLVDESSIEREYKLTTQKGGGEGAVSAIKGQRGPPDNLLV